MWSGAELVIGCPYMSLMIKKAEEEGLARPDYWKEENP